MAKTFSDFARENPTAFKAALRLIPIYRLAELLDRGEHIAIGQYVWHTVDSAKHDAESVLERIEQGEPLEMPAFLRRQAD